MLLQRLREYSERLPELPPSMYARTPIRWLLDLEPAGRLLGVRSLGDEKGRGERLLAPHVQRSSGVRAKLLADNGEYVLGIARDPAKQERVDRCHEAFVAEVAACAEATGEPAVAAVLQFLRGLDLSSLDLPEDFEPASVITFTVGSAGGRVLPIDLPSVRRYWASATAGDEAGEEDEPQECLVCGEVRPAERRMPFKVKGVPGGQPSGTALISANENAFESYGLEASLTAPTCRECAERFTNSLNALLKDRASHVTVGPVVYAFWTRTGGFNPVSLLSDPDPAEVRELIAAAWHGRVAATQLDDETAFFAIALSASGGRVVVRDWLDTTVGAARRSLARFFALQRLVDPVEPASDDGRPYGIYALAAATVREPRRDLPPQIPEALLRCALRCGPLPPGLVYQVVRRSRAEQKVTRPRAVLIKMTLLARLWSSCEEENDMSDPLVRLDAESRDPAYQCGRLMAVVEAIQRRALPGINATVTDRFYGSASSAPGSVFGTLLRQSRPHLAKLRKGEPKDRAAAGALEKRLEEVLSGLDGFPATLDLDQQARFALGYYHQKAAARSAAAAHKKKRRRDAKSQAADVVEP